MNNIVTMYGKISWLLNLEISYVYIKNSQSYSKHKKRLFFLTSLYNVKILKHKFLRNSQTVDDMKKVITDSDSALKNPYQVVENFSQLKIALPSVIKRMTQEF